MLPSRAHPVAASGEQVQCGQQGKGSIHRDLGRQAQASGGGGVVGKGEGICQSLAQQSQLRKVCGDGRPGREAGSEGNQPLQACSEGLEAMQSLRNQFPNGLWRCGGWNMHFPAWPDPPALRPLSAPQLPDATAAAAAAPTNEAPPSRRSRMVCWASTGLAWCLSNMRRVVCSRTSKQVDE